MTSVAQCQTVRNPYAVVYNKGWSRVAYFFPNNNKSTGKFSHSVPEDFVDYEGEHVFGLGWDFRPVMPAKSVDMVWL